MAPRRRKEDHGVRRRLSSITIAILASLATGAAQAQAPTFDITFDSFRKALDSNIREDTADKSNPNLNTTNVCRKAGNSYTCNFHDAGFQSAVAKRKQLNLMNGRFLLKLNLVVDTTEGKVSRVILTGDRGDPANAVQFVGNVERIINVFDPETGQEEAELTKLDDELGLMRGDNADDIGRPRTAIQPHVEIDCLAQNSHVTTRVVCQFVPRS
jgi:hypothetical protein